MDLDLSIAGAKEERAKLKQFHTILNSPSIVPEQAYRMSANLYPLVCYINNIIGLYLSKNYEVIPLFINRALKHINTHPAQPAGIAYHDTVTLYLRHMAHVLKSYSSMSHELLCELIPEEVLNAGPQQIPSIAAST